MNDISSFYFRAPKEFKFHAGQYVQITLPHEHADSEGSTRFFTISSSPREMRVMITTRRTKSSFKKALFSLKRGSELQCFGPMGTFILQK